MLIWLCTLSIPCHKPGVPLQTKHSNIKRTLLPLGERLQRLFRIRGRMICQTERLPTNAMLLACVFLIFKNAIFLYDDRMLITFNYKDGTQTVRFEDTLTADCGEKSLRLRSNESPSGAFEQQNGLAQARWRGLAPTSSDFFVCGMASFGFDHNAKDFIWSIAGTPALIECLRRPAQRIRKDYRDRLGKSEKPSRFALKKFFPHLFYRLIFLSEM